MRKLYGARRKPQGRARAQAWAVGACLLLGALACGQKLNPGGEGTPEGPAGNGNAANGNATDGNVVAVGCLPSAVTYSTGASNVITQKCVNCHATGGTSPALGNYAQAKAGFASGGGQAAVDDGSMPIGSQKLTAAEKCILTNWKAGAYAQ